MATKKTTGSKEPKPKASKAVPTKSPTASRAPSGSVTKKATKDAASPAATTSRTPRAATKAASKVASKVASKTAARATTKAPTKTASKAASKAASKTGTKATNKATTKATSKATTKATISVASTAIAEPTTAPMVDQVNALNDGTVADPSSVVDPTPRAEPAAPAVKPIFRRVGNAWMKFDPSDLEGIAKADAEAAAIAANPELAPPPPPVAKRPEPRQHQQPRVQHQQGSAAAVLDATPDQAGDDGDGEHDDTGDDQAWEGAGHAHHAPEPPAPIEQVTGVLELSGNEARLRQFGSNGWVPSHDEPQVPADLVQRFNLRNGNQVTVNVQMVRVRKRRGPKKLRRMVVGIESVEGMEPSAWAARPPYGELTSIDPQPRMHLEYRGCPPACRLIDLFCPIGFGTRGLIVAPPKAGKTILLQQIAHGIKHNHPQVELIALLIDERPEEVTDFRRNVPALVLASSNDQDLERHTQMGIMAIERARRLFEAGKDVVVLLDSLTRLGRAFNNNRRYSTGGRTMSGGLDSRALDVPKQLFGAARKAEEGGSLTIIATCLVDTGSRADQVIFEEFKGTGNMELILDRSIAERRVYPAINLAASGTRKEHLLMGERELKTMTALRRRLMTMPPFVQVEQLVAAVNRTTDNETLVRGSGG
ncbi:MAG: hypothetical protein RJA05_1530 [Planctomycetota bacterium]